MVTLQILGGRKEKIRPGDVLGALTKDLGLPGAQVGKINVNEFSTYVAVERVARACWCWCPRASWQRRCVKPCARWSTSSRCRPSWWCFMAAFRSTRS
jgi:hypothetical protein